MSYTPATKTKEAIDASIYADQGAAFRKASQNLLPKMSDAYGGRSDAHRSHFGLSNCGHTCARALWYSWKWVKAKLFPARVLRLFNRGHLEEARFLAMLVSAKFEVYFETEEGGQFKLDDHNGHAGSAIDGIVVGIPDLPAGEAALTEMKTHAEKSFNEVVRKGVMESKFIHYVQMQVYMNKYELKWALYMAVNKNNDEIHLELVHYDPVVAERYLERSGLLIYSDKAPARLSDSPGWYECKFCEFTKICHQKEVPEINCRTCIHSTPIANKEWHCSWYDEKLPKEVQLRHDCPSHLFNPELLNAAKVVEGDESEGWLKISWLDKHITLGNGEDNTITSKQLQDGDH